MPAMSPYKGRRSPRWAALRRDVPANVIANLIASPVWLIIVALAPRSRYLIIFSVFYVLTLLSFALLLLGFRWRFHRRRSANVVVYASSSLLGAIFVLMSFATSGPKYPLQWIMLSLGLVVFILGASQSYLAWRSARRIPLLSWYDAESSHPPASKASIKGATTQTSDGNSRASGHL